ncbi:layilin [Sceloporus undulatus]|uniref:layilin n=1 Tax=Sceloporus undulatus TaxID=8520 RepID=UPI001C4D2989|nr:layilin [Sceloporus undulatus]XP_042331305.1 layilin [Sceloporus undulatus]
MELRRRDAQAKKQKKQKRRRMLLLLGMEVMGILLLVPGGLGALALPSGQAICRGGTQRPCYKIIYLHDVGRRVGFKEALQACRRDGGDLVSIESQSEQNLIEKMIASVSASDGDFWIGLTREEDPDNSTECQNLYSWSDGSLSTFRNWYADEPSCGSEICVVMYHQPSAPAGDGGPYMFQWNDDRCNMKNNFICKYAQDKPTVAPEMNASVSVVVTESLILTSPEEAIREDITNKTLKEAKEPIWSLVYILVPSIPALLLLLVITGIFCFWLSAKRRREQTQVNVKEHETWASPKRQKSPSLEIYNVIREQSEADLAGTRPDIKNSSFRIRSGEDTPDDLSGDYDNMAVNTSESGFVTLASTESGFVTNDIYELCNDRVGRSKESTWVENEIYGY